MKVKLRWCFVPIVLMGMRPGIAYAQFDLGAEVRPRTEYRHGFKQLFDAGTQDPAFFTEQRTRLNGAFRHDQWEVLVSLQDVRIWGSEKQANKPSDGASTNFAAVHQAWGKFYLNKKWAVKAGRQELDYDNARFLGNVDWAQQARSHDAVLLTYQDSTTILHIGGAYNQDAITAEAKKLTETNYNQQENYKTMQYLWYHRSFKDGGVSVLFFNNGVQAFDADGKGLTRYSHTAGFFTKFMLKKAQASAEGYYQFGKDPQGNDLSAFLFGANLTLPFTGKTSFNLGADYVSGTGLNSPVGANRSFTPLYGTNHKFYGYMDYFYVGNPTTQMGKTVGLIDPYLGVKVALPKGTLLANVHQFFSPVAIYKDPELLTGDFSASLGTEIDLLYNLDVAKGVNFKLGYSQLFASGAMEWLKKGNRNNLQNWAWMMLTFQPTYSFKNK